MNCCKSPSIKVMDYKRYTDTGAFVIVDNRHCLSCGSHQHAGKQFTRAEWDALLATSK